MTLEPYEILATGRAESLFDADETRHRGQLEQAFTGARVAVIGAAGSIGAAVVRLLLEYRPAALALLDLNENGLVEMMRDLRSAPRTRTGAGSAGASPAEMGARASSPAQMGARASSPAETRLRFDCAWCLLAELQALPIGLGSRECARFFRESPPFDFTFNLCALKHVRSEKSVYSIQRMIDTNVLFPAELLADERVQPGKFFSVSSDKAVRPASLLGASKRAMELALLVSDRPWSSARFANVAFSAGSLPCGMLRRIEKRQPLAAPSDVRRYFISHREAAQICLLACVLGKSGEIFIPRLDERLHVKSFPEIAAALLAQAGYQAVECADEDEARARFDELFEQRRWPCCFQPAATSGEKPLEEFHGAQETVDWRRFDRLGVIDARSGVGDPAALRAALANLRQLREQPRTCKEDYLRELAKLLPDFTHVETGRNLDEQM